MANPVTTNRAQFDALSHELQVTDWWLVQGLRTFGLDRRSACLVPWLPAIELAWVDGMTTAERRLLSRLLYARHPALVGDAAELLECWLTDRPADGLFRIAQRALRAQLAGLPGNERAALRARIIGPYVAVADVSGGLFGFGARSQAERAWLQRLTITMRVPDERALSG